MKQIKET